MVRARRVFSEVTSGGFLDWWGSGDSLGQNVKKLVIRVRFRVFGQCPCPARGVLVTKLVAIVTTPTQLPLAVITVTYSPGQYLGSFLDSLPSAYARGTKVVLADNGSTDGVP